jgi:rRNA maturation endonuclease Nob1
MDSNQPMTMGDMHMSMKPMEMRMGNMAMHMGASNAAAHTPTEIAPATKRFCSQCGASVKESDRFCTSCGHRLSDA